MGNNELADSRRSWIEYRELVLQELKTLHEEVKNVDKKVAAVDSKLTDFRIEMTKDITTLKVKAGLLGALSGGIPSLIAILIILMDKYFNNAPPGVDGLVGSIIVFIKSLIT